ncbi:MAG: DNA polymerase III subunit delta [Betaproteobacteria bacterium]|nr:DNA polymerase III subunit delta [Betaproteobacteria bacterium]
MRIDSEQLPQHLARGLKPLYTVFGDEPLLALEAADRIRLEARRAGFSEREVLIADSGFGWDRLLMSSASLSLFGARRVLDLRIPSGKPGVEGGEALAALCERLPANTVTLVSLPGLDWQTQKSKWFAALDAAGVMIEARAVDRGRLPQWIAGRLAAQKQKADNETLEFLADRVEGNLLAAFQEIQKLALLFPAGNLGFEQVKDSVLDVARYDVFQLGEALLAGDGARFARILEGLKGEGVAPTLVLWAIVEEIRALARISEGLAAGRPVAQLMKEARVWGPRQAAVQRALKRVAMSQLMAALAHAAQVDRTIKGIKRGDAWDALLGLGERLLAPARTMRNA